MSGLWTEHCSFASTFELTAVIADAATGCVATQSAQKATLGNVSDADDLVDRCKAGDVAAFRDLFRRHRGDVARLVHRMLGPSSDLDDVIQEVFLQVHRSIKDFRGTSQFTTWLYRVTVNVVLMHRRAARSRPVFAEAPPTLVAHDSGPLPDEQVARLARAHAFQRLLDRLSDKKRTVFVLHELQGLSPVEIARIVGAPVLTVRTRLFYARRELAQMLRDEPALAQIADELGQPIGAELVPKPGGETS
jgi:RNA polymerase sigma-70 factor (ECF subfamily)